MMIDRQTRIDQLRRQLKFFEEATPSELLIAAEYDSDPEILRRFNYDRDRILQLAAELAAD